MFTHQHGLRSSWIVLLVFICATTIYPETVRATPSQAAANDTLGGTYRSDATEVRLTFSAVDGSDHGLTTLQAGDFAVVDENVVVRNFRSFVHASGSGVEIAILIDASESVTPRFQQELIDVIQMVSDSTEIPENKVSVIAFQGSESSVLCAGNCRTTGVSQKPVAQTGGRTPLFDSVVFASRFLSQRADPRAAKALIVFSDGEDNSSRNSLADAVEVAQAADVQIYGIDLSNPSFPSPGTAVLNRIAAFTGGYNFPISDGAARALNTILESLRATYTVSYQIPNRAAGFHAIQILPTHNRDVQFRSRSGYYYPSRVQ
jgi:Ca-activated chloride channel family protein